MEDQTEFTDSALSELIPSSADESLPAAQPEVMQQPEPVEALSEETGVNETVETPPEPASPAEAQPSETPQTVPFAAYENERRLRQEAQQERNRLLQSQQQPQQAQPEPEAPDLWEDPEAALQYQAQQLESKFQAELQLRDKMMLQNRVETSEMLVKQQYADYDQVTETFAQAAMQNEQLAHQMLNHPMPAKFAYETGKQMMALQQFGNDPDAYRAKLEAEILAKHGLTPGQPGQVAPSPVATANVPTSLASAPSAPAPSQNGAPVEQMSLEQLIGE